MPKSFSGVRDAKEVENFLWNVERYFKALHINDDAENVDIASLYFTDDAMLWWRRRCMEAEKGLCSIETWKNLKKIKSQFYPENVGFVTRWSLRQLKHTRTIKEYIAEFTRLMLAISSMGEEVRLFFFLDGTRGRKITSIH
ncbi:RNA polymerase beta'' chain [Iris pallida]|uniref:RNA polymerase beta'' chain (Chloroplast) n=1 Tax=Iris pallida TaxID=29817 RepID=A0AAX6EQI9_IRIPA|nr:RNA polymerase beta'' chain [Iris pallida]